MESGLKPPPGIKPNFDNPYSLGPYNTLCQAACLTVSTILVSLRMFVKFHVTKAVGIEDYATCVAWFGLIAYAVLSILQVQSGLGTHQWDLPLATVEHFQHLSFGQEILYGPLILITKVSILWLYSRLFAPRRKSKTYFFIHLLLYTMTAFYTAITTVKIFKCVPQSKIFNKSIPGKCINFEALLYVTGIVNICSDIFILVLPLGTVWRLHMPRNQKIGVSFAFTAALFAPVASIMRLIASIQLHADQTYGLFSVALWTEAEITTGIICSCLPALPALFRRYFTPTPLSSSTSRSRRPSSHRKSQTKYLNTSVFGTKDSKQISDYYSTNDGSQLRPDEEFLELENYDRTNESGISSINEGGRNADGGRKSDKSIDLESAPPPSGKGIAKIIRMETFPRPARAPLAPVSR